jgi:hypothetical protein
MTTGSNCIGECAGVEQEQHILHGILQQAADAIPFDLGCIIAGIAACVLGTFDEFIICEAESCFTMPMRPNSLTSPSGAVRQIS